MTVITMIPTEFSVSGAVTVSANDQVVKNIIITVTNGNGITCTNYTGVVIQNCIIRYAGGHGISLTGSDNVLIERVNIIHTGAPATGEGPSTDRNGINVDDCEGTIIRHVLSTDPSCGIYLRVSANPTLSYIKVVNPRGPFPRGQAVQFNGCTGFVLEDFYELVDTAIGWTVDGVSAYSSTGIIRRGVIDGNNCPNGSCVQVEHSSSVVVSDVDAYHWLNAAFSTSNCDGTQYLRCKASDNYKPDPVRGAPSSTTGLVAITYDYEDAPPAQETVNIVYDDCEYYNLAALTGTIWDEDTCTTTDLVSNNFAHRTPIVPIVPKN